MRKHDFVYSAGYRQAVRVSLPASEWDDCAAGFRLHMLSKYPDSERLAQLCSVSPALIFHCAQQYALDYRRKLSRHRERLLSELVQLQGTVSEYDIPDAENAVEAMLTRIAFQQQVREACATLSPASLDYLQRRFREQQSYAEIAQDTGKSINAIEQTVSRALKQLRVFFQNQAQENQHALTPPPRI